MPFLDLIKNAIFVEEPAAKPPLKPSSPGAAAGVHGAATPPVAAGNAGALPLAGMNDNQFYSRLAKQTDLAAVPELAKIESFAAPLAAVLQDKSLRYKAALATAQSQAGLTKAALMKGFDTLLAVLESSGAAFDKQSGEVARTEVDARTGRIGELSAAMQQKQKEIADMQQQVQALQSEMESSRARLQQAKASFAAAYERRKSEIEQQRKEFETILQ